MMAANDGRTGRGGNGGAGCGVRQGNGHNGGHNGHGRNDGAGDGAHQGNEGNGGRYGGGVHQGSGDNEGGVPQGARRNGDNECQPQRNQDRCGPYGPVRAMETENMEVISGQSGTQQFNVWKAQRTVENNLVTINQILTSEDTSYKGKFLMA